MQEVLVWHLICQLNIAQSAGSFGECADADRAERFLLRKFIFVVNDHLLHHGQFVHKLLALFVLVHHVEVQSFNHHLEVPQFQVFLLY